jgi:hypothetical protein
VIEQAAHDLPESCFGQFRHHQDGLRLGNGTNFLARRVAQGGENVRIFGGGTAQDCLREDGLAGGFVRGAHQGKDCCAAG